MSKETKRNKEDFEPTFYGFTGGIKKGESMSDFCKRINKEGVY